MSATSLAGEHSTAMDLLPTPCKRLILECSPKITADLSTAIPWETTTSASVWNMRKEPVTATAAALWCARLPDSGSLQARPPGDVLGALPIILPSTLA